MMFGLSISWMKVIKKMLGCLIIRVKHTISSFEIVTTIINEEGNSLKHPSDVVTP